MNLNSQYENCFWTASGELDCQSPTQTGSSYTNPDHSYHIPNTGMKYLTHTAPQLNQNLGYAGRSCGQPTQVQSFRPALTHFNLPSSAQPNSYQYNWSRQPASRSGFVYPTAQPNCTSCYAQQSPSQWLPYGNQPSPQIDSEASYNYGWGLPSKVEPEPVSAYNEGSEYETVDFSNSGPVTAPVQPVQQSTAMVQYGSGYGQPFSSQPYNMNTHSLVQYKAPSLMNDLGKPDVVDPSLGGIAIWKENTLRNKLGGIFKRVELHDEKVPNLNPPYIGNVYSWVKMSLKSNLFRDILDLFPNVWYDRQKRWLTVRTDTLDNNLATIALICLINRGTLSVRQCRHYDLQRKYMLTLNQQSCHFNRYSRAAFVNVIKRCALR